VIMLDIVVSVVLAFLLMLFVFVPLGIAGAIAFHWLGDKAEEWIIMGQDWQKRKGYW